MIMNICKKGRTDKNKMIKRTEIVGDLLRAKKSIDFWRTHVKTEGMEGLSVGLGKISGELGGWITMLQEAGEITFPKEGTE